MDPNNDKNYRLMSILEKYINGSNVQVGENHMDKDRGSTNIQKP